MKQNDEQTGWNLSNRATQPLRCSPEYLRAIAAAEEQIRKQQPHTSDFKLERGFPWLLLALALPVLLGLALVIWVGFEILIRISTL